MNGDSNSMATVRRWLPLAVVAGALIAYANTFSCPFLFDDNIVIVSNPKIFHAWPPWNAVISPTRFLGDISFALNYAISGFNMADFHLTNIVIHALAGLFLFGVVHRTLRLPRYRERFAGAAPWLAAATAVIWTVHPLQTEAVTYIAQRLESIMGLFYFMGLYFFARGVCSAHPRGWLDGCLAACLLGMGSKEMIATLPFVVLVYDWVFVAPSLGALLRERWKFHLAMLLALVVFALFSLVALSKTLDVGTYLNPDIGRATYALTQLQVICHYLRLVFVPYPLCLDYVWPPFDHVRQLIAPGFVILFLLAATGYGIIRRRPYGFLGALFFLVLAPTSSILPLPDMAFEHRMYVPLAAVIAGVVAAVYWAMDSLARRSGWNRGRLAGFAGALTLAIIATLVVMTRARNEDYRSEETMWRDVLQKRPDNYRAYIALSSDMVNTRRFEEAATIASNLLARLPDFSQMSVEEANRHVRRQRYFYALAHSNLGSSLLNRGQDKESEWHFRETLRIAAECSVARNNLAMELYQQHRKEEAIEQWLTTLRWSPDDLTAHGMLGTVFEEDGKFGDAILHYREALRVRPNDVFVLYRLAWLLATAEQAELRNGAEALRLAEKVDRATEGESPRVFDLLGAAYAETGDFRKAADCAAQALRLAQKAGEGTSAGPGLPPGAPGLGVASNAVLSALLTEITNRIVLYREGKPFRRPVVIP